MKRLALLVCLLVSTLAAQAQFEKGKWFVNPSISGLNLSYNTDSGTNFGLGAKGGAFLVDNVALLVRAGVVWHDGDDFYTLGVGGRYYFDKVGVFMGADLNLNNCNRGNGTLLGFGVEAGYAFFLSRSVTIEPAVYWDVNKDRSEFGLKVGFGIYF